MADNKPSIDELRTIEAFKELNEDELTWLAERMELRDYAPGEIMAPKGAPADQMAAVIRGEFQAKPESATDDTRVFVIGEGRVSGLLPYSRMQTWPATSRITKPSRIAFLNKQHFPEMLQKMPWLGARLVEILADRVREATTQDLNRDRLAAIGKLSAGFTHELNNPAAATRRAASNVRDALARLRKAERGLASHELNPGQYCALAEVEEELATRTGQDSLDALERSEREEAIGQFLDDRGIDNAWELAGALVDANFEEEHLQTITQALPSEALGAALERLSASVTLARLADEIEHASSRISSLVKAMKDYSYMDQAPQQTVDVHRSIETTLTMLHHELKGGIKIVREYDEKLPKILGLGGELNQVWTNLIDNAMSAMNCKGVLTIRTGRELEGIFVDIIDNGPGIPKDIQTRIFDPFFTTKPMGEGTGLGLDITRRIVNKHQGYIRLESQPGNTCFHVWLPLEPKEVRAEDNGDSETEALSAKMPAATS
jgi:signal transduction histidine kinase